ncbi:MAG: hypothetical protein ACJ750_01155 [Gaiellaceae bacterium]
MRLTIGAALVALVAVGAVLVQLEPIVIVALTAAACVLIALVGRAYARERVPARDERPGAEESPSKELAAPELAKVVDVEPEPELAVSERSARAILASGPPPVQASTPREPEREPAPDLEPEPERKPGPSLAPREWNIWALQQLVRERPDDHRHEEWAALIASLRAFARVDGTLPGEFDELVRDSFGELVVEDSARTETAAAP